MHVHVQFAFTREYIWEFKFVLIMSESQKRSTNNEQNNEKTKKKQRMKEGKNKCFVPQATGNTQPLPFKIFYFANLPTSSHTVISACKSFGENLNVICV